MKELVRVATKYNVVFNIEKIKVGESAVFVGMLIRCQKNRPPIILPDPKNVEALLAIPIPQTRKELRQFLGLANVVSKFAPEHQRRAQPLYSLINMFTGPKAWTPEHMAAFKDVKRYLSDLDNII